MGFQFKNSQTGYKYYLTDIDEIAANFWGVEVDSKWFAAPKDRSTSWFDKIGWAIDQIEGKSLDKDNITMPEIVAYMIYLETKYAGDKINLEYYLKWVEYLQPYIDLCNHLHKLNIVGIQV
jgi:hypothetical protein